jgi:hypothetical protein
LASTTARASGSPRARNAAIAADKVQPVPCVCRVGMRGAANRIISAPSKKMSTASSLVPWPPLTSTARGPSCSKPSACARISASLAANGVPSSRAASCRFGVIRSARGSSSAMIVATASSVSSGSPLVATITGSTTSGTRRCRARPATTASTVALSPSMPVLAAPTVRSDSTLSIWLPINAGGATCTPCTPCVFCAVSAVITDAPYTSSAAKVFRSAWIPAPPELSEPAIVSAMGAPILSCPSSGSRHAHSRAPPSFRSGRSQEKFQAATCQKH